MSSFNPDMMYGQPGEVIDDAETLEAVTEATQHALDVPQDWADANPYEIETGIPAGSGYGSSMDMGGGGPMDMAPGMGEGMGAGMAGMAGDQGALSQDDAAAMRDALFSRLQGEKDRSGEYQDMVQEDNMMDRKAAKKMGY